jgi:hypothetical protein
VRPDAELKNAENAIQVLAGPEPSTLDTAGGRLGSTIVAAERVSTVKAPSIRQRQKGVINPSYGPTLVSIRPIPPKSALRANVHKKHAISSTELARRSNLPKRQGLSTGPWPQRPQPV